MYIKNILITLATIVITQIFIFAQDEMGASVKRSTDKVKIEGKYYFIHIVREGETLYSISKAYNVSQMEIAMENPDIYLGIQIDQALKIPINENSNLYSDKDRDDDFIYHIVRKGETLFGLSKKYSVPIEKIIEMNPEVETGIKISQVVLIPKEKLTKPKPQTLSEGERFIYHEVQPKEGFYSITRRYGVSEQTIRRFNADLVADGLKLGTILRIPKNINDSIPDTGLLPPKAYGVPELPKLVIEPTCNPDRVMQSKKQTYNVALLLPFYTNEFESSDTAKTSRGRNTSTGRKEIPQRSINFLDFYQGAMIALDSLKKIGMDINLYVFDTNKSASDTKNLIKETGIQNADLIIGPVYPEVINPIISFANEKRVPVISPLLSSSFLLNKNPYLFQVTPSFQTQLHSFSNTISFCSGQNIVIIHDADSTNNGMLNNFKELIKSRIQSCENANDIHFKEVTYQAGSPTPEIIEKISHSLTLEKENIIIVPSNNEAFVADLLGNLNTLSSYYKYQISLYGFPRWQRFKSVQLEYFYQLQLHLFSPHYVNYSDVLAIQFVNDYRSKYRVEPSTFSFQGYDVMFYFLSALNEFGKEFPSCLIHHKPKLIQTEYNFIRTGTDDGFENNSIYLLRYNKEFTIENVTRK